MLSLFSNLIASLTMLAVSAGDPWRTQNEMELVGACIAGNKRAWDDFVDSFSNPIYSAIHKTLRQRSISYDKDTVDEIFQSVFVSLCAKNYTKLKSFQGKSKLTTWLFAISMNHTKDYLKSFAVKLTYNQDSLEKPITENLVLGDTIPDNKPQSIDKIEKEEELMVFQQAKEQLNDREQMFLNLHYTNDLSLAQIADIFHTNQNNIYQLKNRIVKKLSNLIEIFYKKDNFASSDDILSV